MILQGRYRKSNPTIEYLKGALRADRRIEGLIAEADRYRDLATRATSRMTATRTSGTGRRSNVEDAVIELVDLSRETYQEAQDLAAKVREIREVIAKVQDDRYRDLLRWKYLNGWNWERITEAMGRVNVSWTHELHGLALLEVKKILHHMETDN